MLIRVRRLFEVACRDVFCSGRPIHHGWCASWRTAMGWGVGGGGGDTSCLPTVKCLYPTRSIQCIGVQRLYFRFFFSGDVEGLARSPLPAS